MIKHNLVYSWIENENDFRKGHHVLFAVIKKNAVLGKNSLFLFLISFHTTPTTIVNFSLSATI